MTVDEMHIAIDLGTQMLNSSALLKLPEKAKDLYLNRSIRNIIKAQINKEVNTVFNVATYQDIREHYNTLSPLVYNTVLSEHSSGYRYSAFLLPNTTQSNITTGVLTVGTTYRVVVAGTTDLSGIGGTTPPVLGDTFTVSGYSLAASSIDIKSGWKYYIYSAGNKNLTTYGAADNVAGTIFTSTSTTTLTGCVGTMLGVLTLSPTWAGGTALLPVFTYDYDHMFVVKANVDNGTSFNSGALVAGKKYRVVTAGATSLLNYGHTTTPSVDSVFLCTTSGTPSWDGITALVETKDVPCRLAKPQDIESMLGHAYGTTNDSPICEIATSADGDLVKVYNDGTFSVNQVDVVYVKKPDKVSKELGVNCNLHENVHDDVVDQAIYLIKRDDDRISQQAQQ